jgi:putative FmdB family regulatory protein
MPWYDFQCRSCDYEFTEVLKMDDREKPTRKKCPGCGRKTVSKLIGNVVMGDAVNLDGGGERPDDSYREVISRINEREGIKGTRYELSDRMTDRARDLKLVNKHRLKQEVLDRLK